MSLVISLYHTHMQKDTVNRKKLHFQFKKGLETTSIAFKCFAKVFEVGT